MYELDDKKIGAHLKELMNERGYKTNADFCRDYLKLKQPNQEITETILQNERKRFGYILKGENKIQTHDLPIVSKLLDVSCEEILSAGKHYAPTRNHVTNYDIAQSREREVWDEYMKREDRLFLNCDEYRKSVIDYALEFENYEFIRYLLDEGFIYFIDNSEGIILSYGARTSIKSNWDRFDMPDEFVPRELREQDRIRTQIAVLAIQKGDCDRLEALRAREIPEMERLFTNHTLNFNDSRNEELIEAIALSYNEKVIEYFSEEFSIQFSHLPNDNLFVFPFIGDVIEKLLENNSFDFAKAVIKKGIEHNKNINAKLSEIVDDEYNHLLSIGTPCKDELKKSITQNIVYDSNNNCISFNAIIPLPKMFAGNIIQVRKKKRKPEIQKLIEELNEWYDRIISLGGE